MTLSAVDEAAPEQIVYMAWLTSKPILLAYNRPSTMPAILPASTIWFAILVCWPLPGPPLCCTLLLYDYSIVFTFSISSLVPPHIVTNFPSLAPTSPPDTGASTLPICNLAAYEWILYAKEGVLVVWSTKRVLYRNSYTLVSYELICHFGPNTFPQHPWDIPTLGILCQII